MTINEQRAITEMYVQGRRAATYIAFRLHLPLAAVEEYVATLVRTPRPSERGSVEHVAWEKRKR